MLKPNYYTGKLELKNRVTTTVQHKKNPEVYPKRRNSRIFVRKCTLFQETYRKKDSWKF